MSKTRRGVLVTLGLSAVGAVVGGAAGALALLLGQLAKGDVGLPPFVYLIAAMAGAKYGAVGAPLFGWLVLRHVPLGRAIGWAATGTVLGGATAWMLRENPIAGAFLGLLVACLLARFYTNRSVETHDSERRTSAGG